MPQWNLWGWILFFFVVVLSFAGSVLGVLASYFLPLGRSRYSWSPKFAGAIGTLAGLYLGVFNLPSGSLLAFPLTALTGLIVSFLLSWIPRIDQLFKKQTPPPSPPDDAAQIKLNQMYFKKTWNVRPQFEAEEEGLFVGRTEFLDRLNSHFISRSGGTILISGVRGVGKTALVDRALVTSRQKLQNRYWKETFKYLDQARPWHLIDRKAFSTLLEREGYSSTEYADYLILKRAAERYSAQTQPWWQKFNPVDRRIRRMHEASRWQLFVLKFSASDISGALPDPGQVVIGKPRIDPEKLLRSLIRKLYVTFDPSRSEDEAKVLQWSLRDKAQRQLFFNTLNAAYNKSISKSYKEIISNTISDILKQTQSITWEGKIDWTKVGIVLLCVAVGVVFSLYSQTQPDRAWYSLDKLIAYGVPGAITGYILISWGFKRVREKTSDQSRQSSFSYEYDYSLHQMRQDLESLVRILSPRPARDESTKPHDPFRCFRRTIVVFDELDKLERADQQLDDVITHFKNFFTLSEAVFVFLTDHEFYEHLTRETEKARLARHYPPQHTFFNEKIYLRKPEFVRFREAFFKFTEPSWIEQQARTLPDAMLIDDILQREKQNVAIVEQLKLETVTLLYVQRRLYEDPQKKAIDKAFNDAKGMENAMAVAQVWAAEATRAGVGGDFDELRAAFDKANGWQDAKAISFLYHRREDLAEADKKKVEDSFAALPTKFLSEYEGVDGAPFTLSDLARALCFQTRNHYFDLYNAVYDYVTSYEDGAPVLVMDPGRYTHEPKLWSRYQQLLEIAFDSARENHPSREYFNALLMESLYRAFDKRGTGKNVKIGEITFPPRDEVAAVAATLLEPEKTEVVAVTPVVGSEADNFQQALNRLVKLASDKLAVSQTESIQQNGTKIQVQPYTDRDADKINAAIIRLLRLALAHTAIRGVTADFKKRLNSENNSDLLKDLEFAWNDNSYSNIRSVIREQYEQELLNFWKEHVPEVDSFDGELTSLWRPIAFAGESARIHTAIGELRMKAELVGIGQGTISGPDATALRANVGTWESREALWPRMILDRIRAEEDANILEVFDNVPPTDPVILSAVQRKTAIETKIGATVRAIVNPRDTKYAIYLVVGQPSATADLAAVNSLLPEKTSLFWYVTGRKAPEFPTPIPERVRIFASPSTGSPTNKRAAQLIEDYVAIASRERLETIMSHFPSQITNTQLVQRAGGEVLGPIVIGSSVVNILTDSKLIIVGRLLKEKRERLSAVGLIDWPDITSNWSAAAATKRLAQETQISATLPLETADVIEQAVSDLFTDLNHTSQDMWVKTFVSATEQPNAAWLMLVKSQIGQLFDKKMDDAKLTEPSLRSAVKTGFTTWLANVIQSATQNLNLDTANASLLNDLVPELERQRKNLRKERLPETSPASTGGANPPKRPRKGILKK